MTDPITREQVERAISKPRNIDYRELPRGWREWAPDYVIAAEAADDWDAERAALTRWRDELATREAIGRLADALPADPGLDARIDAELRAIDDSSPERLRERREALGWTLADAAAAVRAHDRRFPHLGACHIEAIERPHACGPCNSCAAYAAALSVEEARLAKLAAERDAHAVPRLGWLEPERPAPRFKVGDWAADDRGEHGQISRAEWSATQVQWRYVMGSVDYPERDLEPTCAPVVTVPQSVVKQHLGIECQWDHPDSVDLSMCRPLDGHLARCLP